MTATKNDKDVVNVMVIQYGGKKWESIYVVKDYRVEYSGVVIVRRKALQITDKKIEKSLCICLVLTLV